MHNDAVVKVLQSLIKSEFDTIKRVKNLILSEWSTMKSSATPVLPRSCCGLLFQDHYAYATNGHWAVRIRVRKDYPKVEGTDFFFYRYSSTEEEDIEGDVIDNHNPFEELGIPVLMFRPLFAEWREHIMKVRIEDLMNIIRDIAPHIKEQRRYAVELQMCLTAEPHVSVRLRTKQGISDTYQIALWHYTHKQEDYQAHEVLISINAVYLFKVLKVMQDSGYFIADITYCDEREAPSHKRTPVVLKCHNPRGEKADIRIAIGQYFIGE